MLKVIGSLLIIFSSVFLGFYLAANYIQRTKQLRQLSFLLAILKTEITYGLRSLTDIFEILAKKEKGIIYDLFLNCGLSLRKNKGISTYECLRQVLDEIWPKTSLKDAEKQILQNLFKVLGTSDVTNQIYHLDLAIASLQDEFEKAYLEQKQYEKMYRTLGFLGGLLLVILIF